MAKTKNQYPAYAVKSDDGKDQKPNILPMLLKAMMAKMKNTETRKVIKWTTAI